MASDHTKNRRRLLKALAGAGGVYTTAKIVPETWSKPVVDALSLPAHALTSVTYFGTVNLGQIVAELSPPAGDPILDLIAPTADAQPLSVIAYICVTPSGSSAMVMVQFQNLVVPDAGVLYSGMVPVGGAATNLSDVEGPQGCLSKEDVVLLQARQPRRSRRRQDRSGPRFDPLQHQHTVGSMRDPRPGRM